MTHSSLSKQQLKLYLPALLFIGPCVGYLLAFVIFPLLYSFILSFTNYSLSYPGPTIFIGLDNYIETISSNEFWQSISNTAVIAIGAVGLEFIRGLLLALFFNRKLKGKNLYLVLLVIPTLMVPIAIGAIWKMLFQPYGLVNYTLNYFGINSIDWLGDPSVVLLSIIIADTWQWTPFIFLILLAGLSAVPKSYYEAAIIDGATAWKSFWYITLPCIKYTIAVAVLIRIIDVIRFFDKIWI